MIWGPASLGVTKIIGNYNTLQIQTFNPTLLMNEFF